MSEWIAVSSETMPRAGECVLAHYLNSLGKPRRVRAMWVTAAMQAEWDDEWEREEEDFRDGWFETAENSDACWRISETVTHWQSLPAPPVLP